MCTSNDEIFCVTSLTNSILAFVVSPKEFFGHSLVRLAILFSIACHAGLDPASLTALRVVIPASDYLVATSE